MSSRPPATPNASRRLVVIDLDWQEVDFLPELILRPEFAVCLVAGEHSDDAGVRVAELCGIPSTLDLADVTREIFDLAMIGDQSGRRAQVEMLLGALGTPVVSPRDLWAAVDRGESQAEAAEPEPEVEPADGDERDWDVLLAQAIPDLEAPGVMGPLEANEESVVEAPEPIEPSPRIEVESADPSAVDETLSSADPSPIAEETTIPADPSSSIDEQPGAWLTVDDFRSCLDQAVERRRQDGLSFSLHRARFQNGSRLAEVLRASLPARMRQGDALCFSGRDSMLLLCAAPAKATHDLRRGIAERSNEVWREGGGGEPAPPLDLESVMLTAPTEVEPFLATARIWLPDSR